jgi:hypothetical protein
MSKKHFIAIAKIISGEKRIGNSSIDTVAKAMADYFSQENPNFDRSRCLAACGIID